MKTLYLAEKDELQDVIKSCIVEVLGTIFNDFNPQRDLCDLAEACKYLGFSKSHIYKLSSKYKIPYRKFGKRLFFSKKELDEWILRTSVHHRTIEDRANEYLLRNSHKRKRF
jgi:excisionase family DNA binding protein